MKKIILFCFMLLIAAFCSACVNTYAVYELNEKALELIEDGDIQGAISRLQSSIDLDPNVFDSRYNLANIYIKQDRCNEALEHAQKANEIKPENPVANYTLAVAYECSANEKIKVKNEDGALEDRVFDTFEQERKTFITVTEYLKEANVNYNKYLKNIHNAEDTDSVLKQIDKNKEQIKNNIETYNIEQ